MSREIELRPYGRPTAIHVRFGALVPPLVEQLAALSPPPRDVAHWQADADAITRLAVRRVLTEAEVDNARRRLMKAIEKGVREPVS